MLDARDARWKRKDRKRLNLFLIFFLPFSSLPFPKHQTMPSSLSSDINMWMKGGRRRIKKAKQDERKKSPKNKDQYIHQIPEDRSKHLTTEFIKLPPWPLVLVWNWKAPGEAPPAQLRAGASWAIPHRGAFCSLLPGQWPGCPRSGPFLTAQAALSELPAARVIAPTHNRWLGVSAEPCPWLQSVPLDVSFHEILKFFLLVL